MSMSLSGTVVLIAGGSGALGKTITPAFVRSGARVISADRNPPPVQDEILEAADTARARAPVDVLE